MNLIGEDLEGEASIEAWLESVEADLALLARFEAFYAARPEPA